MNDNTCSAPCAAVLDLIDLVARQREVRDHPFQKKKVRGQRRRRWWPLAVTGGGQDMRLLIPVSALPCRPSGSAMREPSRGGGGLDSDEEHG